MKQVKTVNNKPGAWICTNDGERQNRGRSKVYQPGHKIYLNDSEEFEIELFNPEQFNIKAEISIDGKLISSGLVLRSGQRVYLECFPDSNRKFTFKTYKVEDSIESKQAILLNGKIDIKFYKEEHLIKKYNQYPYYYPYPYPYYYPYYDTTYICNCGNTLCNCRLYNLNTTTSNGKYNNSVTYNSTSISTSNTITGGNVLYSSNIETGQVDGGEVSSQEFENVNMNFESYVISSYSFQMLPMSQRPEDPKSFKIKKKGSKIDRLIKIKELLESHIINQEEFDLLKKEII